MANIPPRAGEERLNKLFAPTIDLPPDDTFEIGLVLGGTVSAGAYTAGALDFLLEALESWYTDAPPHKVILKTVAGTSGGAVCSAILGLLSSRKVPHIKGDLDTLVGQTSTTGNPLWDLWVNEFQIDRLLSTSDIDRAQNVEEGTGYKTDRVQHVASLLNADMIDNYIPKLVALGTSSSEPLPYFSSPFRVAVTVANMRGIPFEVCGVPALLQFDGAAFVQHDDHAWFAFPNGANPTSNLPEGKREDEFWLSKTAGPVGSGIVGYPTLAAWATASGAMPVGLPARLLWRPAEHYLYRPQVRPTADPPGWRIDWPDPALNAFTDIRDGECRQTAVDGGTFNNDPVSLAHRALCGLVGRNPRGPVDAKRAIFMIDPLADQAKPIDPSGKSLLAVVKQIIGTAVSGARYLTADMELFARQDVFSRYQLVPFRVDRQAVGEAALAGTTLYAAAGWCAREFRAHDFLLGRANMRAYINHQLVLRGDNSLFKGWSNDQRMDYARTVDGGRIEIAASAPHDSYYLPILPDLTGSPDVDPRWPVNAADPDKLREPLEKRLKAVLGQLVEDNADGALPWIVRMFALPGVADFVASEVVQSWKQELTEAGLRM